MKCLAPSLALVLSGCTFNAITPIQANTQVDQRQGTFAGGGSAGGQVQIVGAGPVGQQTSVPVGTSKPGSTTVPASPAVSAASLAFGPVKDFPPESVFQVLSETTVVVASGKDVAVTQDDGRSWASFSGVASQPIRAIFFLDAEHGWVGGYSGSLMKVTLSSNSPAAQVQDAGSNKAVVALHFLNAGEGLLCDEEGLVRRTTNGGAKWDEGVSVSQRRFGQYSRFKFIRDLDGGVVYNTFEQNWSNTGGNLARYSGGAFLPVNVNGNSNLGVVEVAEGRAFVSETFGAQTSKDGTWFYTDDWSTFTKIETPLKTSKQIIRDKLVELMPATKNLLLGHISEMYGERYLWSRDAGETWQEPFNLKIRPVWIRPFSESKAWAWDGKTLYRSGR